MNSFPKDYLSIQSTKLKIEPQVNDESLGGLLMFSVPSIIYLEQDDHNPICLERWKPDFPRPCPDLFSDDPYLFESNSDIFDFHLEIESDVIPKEFKEYFVKACKETLSPSISGKFIQMISIRSLLKCGFGMNQFRSLMENNPSIASFILSLMKKTEYPEYSQYLALIMESPMTLAKNEIMVQLAPHLTQETLYSYISMCVDFCNSDKSQNQARHVRLLCLFIIALLKTKILNLSIDLFELIKMFCIQNAQIKDAANLYQILEQLKGK